jgi:predicted secreted protein
MNRFDKDSGPIRARVGEPFAVELEAIPGAGYVWSLPHPPDTLPVVEATTQPGRGIGGGARQEFIFRPTTPGSATLVIEYGRPWESAPLEKVEIPVQVEA